MLLLLNDGESVTVRANNSKTTNSYLIANRNNKTLYCRHFPYFDNPPKSDGDSKIDTQPLKDLISELRHKIIDLQILCGLSDQHYTITQINAVIVKLESI